MLYQYQPKKVLFVKSIIMFLCIEYYKKQLTYLAQGLMMPLIFGTFIHLIAYVRIVFSYHLPKYNNYYG